MVHVLTGLVLAFKLWLVRDAHRRREACYWPWIILFVPLGGVVYFFLIKLDGYSLAWITDVFQRTPTVEDLELQYRQTPSFSNRVTLAGAFYREGRYAEAAEHYTAPPSSKSPRIRKSSTGWGSQRSPTETTRWRSSI